MNERRRDARKSRARSRNADGRSANSRLPSGRARRRSWSRRSAIRCSRRSPWRGSGRCASSAPTDGCFEHGEIVLVAEQVAEAIELVQPRASSGRARSPRAPRPGGGGSSPRGARRESRCRSRSGTRRPWPRARAGSRGVRPSSIALQRSAFGIQSSTLRRSRARSARSRRERSLLLERVRLPRAGAAASRERTPASAARDGPTARIERLQDDLGVPQRRDGVRDLPQAAIGVARALSHRRTDQPVQRADLLHGGAHVVNALAERPAHVGEGGARFLELRARHPADLAAAVICRL